MMKRWWRVKKRPSGSTRATVRSSGQRSRSSEKKWDLLCWYLELFTFCFVDIWNYSQFALLIFGIIHIFTSLYPCNVHVVKLFSCSRWKRSGVSFLNSNSPPSEFGRPSKLIFGNTWDSVPSKNAACSPPYEQIDPGQRKKIGSSPS